MFNKVLFLTVLWCVSVNCKIEHLLNEDGPSKMVDLSKMGIVRLKNNFLSSSNTVTEIDLSNNNIFEIENSAFDGFRNLKYLNLTENIFPFENLNSANLSTVETLVLDQAIVNRDEKFYTDCDYYLSFKDRGYNIIRFNYLKHDYVNTIEFLASMKFSKLKKLYLRQNKIEQIQLSSTSTRLSDIMPSITHLYLNDNQLENVYFLYKFPSTLTHLHLDNNDITQIKTDRSTNNLKVLTVDRNKIEILCEPYQQIFPYQECKGISLEMFQQLEHFSISQVGPLEVRSNSFKFSAVLNYLSMSYNFLRRIDDETFHNLINLQTLILDYNQMNTIPKISHLKNLQHFSIAGNNLEALNESNFHGLSNLKKLNLNNIYISEIIPGTFDELVSLEELDLSQNKLEVLPTNWISLEIKLKYLSLSNNLFKSLSSLSLMGIKSLQYISIAKNPLKLIDIKSLMALSENATVETTIFEPCHCRIY